MKREAKLCKQVFSIKFCKYLAKIIKFKVALSLLCHISDQFQTQDVFSPPCTPAKEELLLRAGFLCTKQVEARQLHLSRANKHQRGMLPGPATDAIRLGERPLACWSLCCASSPIPGWLRASTGSPSPGGIGTDVVKRLHLALRLKNRPWHHSLQLS